MTRKIYKKTTEENCQQFITRVVNTEDRPMRPQDVLDVCFVVGFKKSKSQVHSHLADSIRNGLITKWRDTERKCIVYAPLSHKAPVVVNAVDNIPQDVEEQLITDVKFPNLLTTLANFYQVDVKEVQKAISDVINDITMNNNDDKTNTLITCLKDICAEVL
jgi:hypothetical protein